MIMEIKKLNNYSEIFLGSQRFVLDPPSLRESPPLILTNISLKVNKDKIFNSPGEYNLGDVYFWGFDDKNSISYFFQSEEGNFFYFNGDLTEETIKKLKSMKVEINALFFGGQFKEKVFTELKPNIVISYKDINLPKFVKEKSNKVKINLKKSQNLLIILL